MTTPPPAKPSKPIAAAPSTAAPATRHILLVSSRPTEGQEAEFDRWYEETHLPEMLALPGFMRATRYAASLTQLGRAERRPHLAVYEIETDNLKQALDELKKQLKGGAFVSSTSMDESSIESHVYSALSPPHTSRR